MLNFALFALITSITPGPNNSMLMASGLRFGIRRTLPHLLGINLGFGFMFLCVGSILPLLPKGTIEVLEYVAMALLIYIAIKIATASTNFHDEKADDRPWGFFQAAAFQWINPKGLMMAFAGATSFGLDNVTGAAIFTIANMVCGTWIFAGSYMRGFLIDNPLRTRILYVSLALIMVLSIVL
ncbi:lysine transporter LysE [Terasakiella brassicae]|uniref:Lysine transporter LysE n=2 Tax=Terasakiella TaxID=196080 RepID=A0A917BRG7_9PROT|nr:LysE family transporter [Terasakiella brassicae]GGF56012.1 lysine transporter LysE [Terasakiella brassicae]